jgi:hypothetical protein
MEGDMSDWILGLDLGQATDPTALAIVHQSVERDEKGYLLRGHDDKFIYSYSCVHLERYPLGTEYPTIIDRVGELVSSRRLQPRPQLVIDATGAGRPVVDLFFDRRMPAEIIPVTIMAGLESREDRWNQTCNRAFWVPKIELVSTLQALLQSRRLRVAPGLALADTLKQEFLNFQVKITASAHETFGAWRDGTHDDLVLAVAMAAWLGDRGLTQIVVLPSRRYPGPAARDRPTGPTHPVARAINQKLSCIRRSRYF